MPSAARLEAGASGEAGSSVPIPTAVEAGATTTVAAEPDRSTVAAPLPPSLPSLRLSGPAAGGGSAWNGSDNGTRGNETPPDNRTPPNPPRNNTSTLHPLVLSPERQALRGLAGAEASFSLVLTNPSAQPQSVRIEIYAPTLWDVLVSGAPASLAPGASAALTGSVRTPPAVGTDGTIAVFAHGGEGWDAAYVDACFRGALHNPCPVERPGNGTGNQTRPPPNGTGNRTEPPTNETNQTRPPGDETNQTRPPTNETPSNGTRPPPNGTRPPQNDTRPPSNTTQPPANGTWAPGSGATGAPGAPEPSPPAAPDSAPSGQASGSVEAWVAVGGRSEPRDPPRVGVEA